MVAKQLKQSGYTIQYGYFGPHKEAKLIQQQGFTVQWMQTYPFDIGIDKVLNGQKQESYLETLVDRLTNRIFKERTADLTNLVTALKPDLIVLDVFLSTDFIILYPLLQQLGSRVVMLQTMLSTYDDGYTPPLNTTLIPDVDSPQSIRWAWRKMYVWRTFQTILDGLKYGGISRRQQIRRAFRRNKLPDTHLLREDKVFHVGFNGLDEWVTTPKAFDFPNRPVQPFQRYINVDINNDRIEESLPAYQYVMSRIEQERLSDPAIKLIYVSLGTVQEAKNKGAEKQFFTRLFAVAWQRPNWRFLIAVRLTLVNDLPKPPATVTLFAQVPQLHLLEYANGFVTHGGLNSILEAIQHQVPMLVYPFNTRWDLPGNAARVAAHGIGLVGNFYKDDTTRMTKYLDRLLTDPAIPNAFNTLTNRFERMAGNEAEK